MKSLLAPSLMVIAVGVLVIALGFTADFDAAVIADGLKDIAAQHPKDEWPIQFTRYLQGVQRRWHVIHLVAGTILIACGLVLVVRSTGVRRSGGTP